MKNMKASKQIKRSIPFEGRKEFVLLLGQIGGKLGRPGDWAEKFAESVLRVAETQGFNRITFKREWDKLEGYSLENALKRGFMPPRQMDALRLWKDGKNVLLRIEEDGVVYAQKSEEILITLAAHRDFERVWKSLSITSLPIVLAEPIMRLRTS